MKYEFKKATYNFKILHADKFFSSFTQKCFFDQIKRSTFPVDAYRRYLRDPEEQRQRKHAPSFGYAFLRSQVLPENFASFSIGNAKQLSVKNDSQYFSAEIFSFILFLLKT